jgi:hypothetical protein
MPNRLSEWWWESMADSLKQGIRATGLAVRTPFQIQRDHRLASCIGSKALLQRVEKERCATQGRHPSFAPGHLRRAGRGHGACLQTNQVYQSILTPEQLSFLETSPETEPFDEDAKKFRLGVEALRLGLAYEYDPYFSLSIARVDPFQTPPHGVEARGEAAL